MDSFPKHMRQVIDPLLQLLVFELQLHWEQSKAGFTIHRNALLCRATSRENPCDVQSGKAQWSNVNIVLA